MALETCFQVGSIATATTATITRACILHAQYPLYYKERLNFPTSRGSKRAISSLSSSSSPSSTSFSSVGRSSRRARFICEAKNAVDEVLAVTDASWNELVVGSEKPALVEFWAPWCGPCRMIAPVIEELAREYAGKLIFLKVNTDDCPKIATEYGIRSIPTVLLFKNGEKKESVIGAVPKSTLCATIEKYVEG